MRTAEPVGGDPGGPLLQVSTGVTGNVGAHPSPGFARAETPVRLGVGSYGTVAWATQQVRTAMHTDAAVRRRVHQIEHEFNQPKT